MSTEVKNPIAASRAPGERSRVISSAPAALRILRLRGATVARSCAAGKQEQPGFVVAAVPQLPDGAGLDADREAPAAARQPVGRRAGDDVAAHKNFGQFRGTTEPELLAWLRQILVNNLAKFVEQHMLAARRDVRREVSIERIGAALEHSTIQLAQLVPASIKSPSMAVQQREEAVVLADRLAQLPDDYREVLVLRNLKGLPFEEVAQRMERWSARRECYGCGRSRSCDRFIAKTVRARPDLNPESTKSYAITAEQERLARILDDYLVSIEQGQCVSPEDLLAKYPEDAPQLRGYLSGLQLFHAAAAPERAGCGPVDSGIPPALQVIGDYRLVREIGRGGMGVVYEAWQISLRRRVALKILPFTAAHDAKQIGRFKNEAQAAAQVQHPNIVPVFAIGEENGSHYYVMQLVEGQSLGALLGSMRSGADPSGGTTAPNNTLTFDPARPARTAIEHVVASSSELSSSSAPMRANETFDHICVVARLGIQAADALDAAHEYGIVHRDVKPSNLLLDDQGKLWVTDFGLARCRENQGLTQTGDVLGTMRYMSPEQALGRTALIDHRTDIYSLGLTMYELATLHHPADELGDLQLLFERDRPVIKPLRHWNRHIPRDFQTIILKCMAEFPHERYASAKELSADLERFIEGRPILASPPSVLSRLGKWAKRRRGVVYAAAAALLVAVVGAAVSGTMLSRERFANNERALQQKNEELRNLNKVLTLFTTEYVDELAAIPGAEAVREKMLHDSVKYYGQFESEAAGDSKFVADSAYAKSKLGTLYDKLGDHKRAVDAQTNAVHTWEKLLARDPANDEYARSLALSLNNLAMLVADDGQAADAQKMLERAGDLLQKLSATESDPAAITIDLATTHGNLGLVLGQMHDKDGAAAELAEAIALQLPLLTNTEQRNAAMRGLAASYNNLASLKETTGQPSAAADDYQKAITYQREIAKADETNRIHMAELARTYSNLGYLKSRVKAWQAAETCFADAIRIQENLVKFSPHTPLYQHDLAISYINLGMAQSRVGEAKAAETSFRSAVNLQDALLAVQPSDAATLSNQGCVWNNLGNLFDEQHRLGDAADAYQQAIQYQQKALAQTPNNGDYRGLLSGNYYKYARNLAAQAKYDDALAMTMARRKLWPGNVDQLYSVAKELAGMYRQLAVRTGTERTKADCIKAAATTLREALAAGLPQDRLNDPSLTALTHNAEFQRLLDESKVGLVAPPGATPTNPPRELTRVN